MLSFKEYLTEDSPLYRILAHNDLMKNSARLVAFVKLINDGKHFITKKGLIILDKKQTIKGNKVDTHSLLDAMAVKGFSASFTGADEHNKKVELNYPKDFYKSSDLGGLGVGSGTAKEDTALSNFKSLLTNIMHTTGEPYVPIKINGRIVNVVDVQTTPGTPKSDFHLLDFYGKEVLWISHKDGTSAKDFQQYGGLTELRSLYPNHKEIEDFINDVRKESNGELNGEKSFTRPIKDTKLILSGIYGINYHSKIPGRQNVDILLQGDIHLTKSGKYYQFTSNHTLHNGELPKEGYGANLFVRKGDRSNFGIKNARFMVAPKALRRKSTIDI